MSISGIITCNQLACPLQDDDKASNQSLVNIIVKCYRLNENELKLTEKDLLSEGNRFVATITCTVEKSKSQTNSSQRIQPILYTCNYTIENLPLGIYSVFGYENCEAAGGSFVYPQKQAFGWSVSETVSKWTQYTIDNSNTTIINANIILRKPHSFLSIGYPTKTDNARFLTINQIPVLQLNGMTPADRGYSHGYLLAPHILDWFYFYLSEETFQSIATYQEFYTLVDPASNFFHYPVDYLLEIEGILRGMQARTDCDSFLYELNRPFDLIDLLAMNSYIERRTTQPDTRTNEMIETSMVALDDASINHPHCSQVVVWNSLTTEQRIITGRNMDGECDIRRVTVSTTLLFAVNSSDKSIQYRYISLMWLGMIGTLSGVNETGLYCMENAGPSQIGGRVIGLTPVSYVATHLLRTLNARLATITEVKNAFEAFAADPIVNNDSKIWPTKRASSDLIGPICGPGCVFMLTTMLNEEGNAFVLEGDRYGGRIRTAMQALPFIPDYIMATNHFHLYDFPSSLHDKHRNFDSYVSFSSMHRYESMRYQLEKKFRLKSNVVHLNLENIRSLLQSACEGRTEHAIEVELEINGNITIHVHLARLEFGLWYAPYEYAHTITFEELFT